MSRIKVTINKSGYIPKLGMGPIRRPTLITEELYDQLIKLGYPVRIINSSSTKKIIEKKISEEVSIKNEEIKIPEIPVTESVVDVHQEVEPAANEVINEEEVVIEENTEEEVTTEEEVIFVDDPDLNAESYYNEEFLTSKQLCKKILANRKIQYDNSANFALLKKLVLDSNPEVEITEEENTEEPIVEENEEVVISEEVTEE